MVNAFKVHLKPQTEFVAVGSSVTIECTVTDIQIANVYWDFRDVRFFHISTKNRGKIQNRNQYRDEQLHAKIL